MDYEVKKLKKGEVEIKGKISPENLAEFRTQAIEELGKDAKIKGFRPGHVPVDVLEKHLGANLIKGKTIELALQKNYAKIMVKEKLEVISQPKVNVTSEDPLEFTITVSTMPEVEVKDYKKIKIAKKEAKVEKEDVEKVVSDIKMRGTTYEFVDRGAKMGDRVELDFEGFDGDKPVESTKSTNHPVILGSNALIPGFEEEVVGLKKGEKKEFDITFPKDYGKEDFQGKKLKFKIEVKSVEEATVPDLSEELIEQVTGKKQKPEEFTKEVEEMIKEQKEKEAEQDRQDKYIKELLDRTKVELPDSLIEDEAQAILADVKADVERKGHKFEEFLERAQTTEEDLIKKYKEEAEKRIKIRLALQHTIREEGIKVEKEDLDAELAKVKSFYPEEQHAKIDQDFEKGSLKMNIINRLALRKFFAAVLD